MLAAKFPVYALRANFGRLDEPPYLLINTKYDRYILDMPMLSGNYLARRLAMLEMELDYKVYPLKERYNTIAQILRSKRKEFIDSDGKVWRLNKTKYYKCKSYPVLHRSKTWSGTWLNHTRAGNFVHEVTGNYVTVIETPKGKVLFDISDEPTTRVRVKI